jgi:DnaJ family protein B protein 4
MLKHSDLNHAMRTIFSRHFSAREIYSEGIENSAFERRGGSGIPFMTGGMPGSIGGIFRMDSMPGMRGAPWQSAPTFALRKAAPAYCSLKLTLEDLYSGRIKKMRISKRIVDSGAIAVVSVDKGIYIKADWMNGTMITYEREGNELPGVIPADVIFTLETKPHDRFERSRDDLIYKCPVSLHDALTGMCTTVQTLDGCTLTITARYVTPETVKIIRGEGIPNSRTRSKGD